MVGVVEIEVSTSGASVDSVLVVVPLESPLEGVLAQDVLHASRKLDAVTILE